MILVRRAAWAFGLALFTWVLHTITVIVALLALFVSPFAQIVLNRRRRLKAPQEKDRA